MSGSTVTVSRAFGICDTVRRCATPVNKKVRCFCYDVLRCVQLKTHTGMRGERAEGQGSISISMEERLLQELKNEAKSLGIPVSKLSRAVFAEFLAGDRKIDLEGAVDYVTKLEVNSEKAPAATKPRRKTRTSGSASEG